MAAILFYERLMIYLALRMITVVALQTVSLDAPSNSLPADDQVEANYTLEDSAEPVQTVTEPVNSSVADMEVSNVV
jgi:hypothetical protein